MSMRSGFRPFWPLLLLAATRVVLADPAVEGPRVCEVASPQEARSLADRLYGEAEYQRAGECYRVAGDLENANLAFLKAAGSNSEDTARALKVQRDAAKSLFATYKHAFHGNH
jgi:hypothetical protein